MRKKISSTTKNKRLRKIARAHAIFSFALFSLYVVLSSVYSPEFLVSDIRNKFSALADEVITITAKVLGPPLQPIATTESRCFSGVLSSLLTWPEDENSTTFDIDRDGLPLITNLTNPTYEDNAVSSHIPYAYVITAHGQMSPFTAISDPVMIVHKECIQTDSSTVQIITIDSKNINVSEGVLRIDSQKPYFSGSTNIPNAIINITIHSIMEITGQTVANANGYWSWQSPVDLSAEQHTIFVTATNPFDASDTTYTSADFIIDLSDEKNENETDSKKQTDSDNNPTTKQQPINQPTEENTDNQLEFSLSLSADLIFENKGLTSSISIDKLSPSFENSPANITYSILDPKGISLYSVSEIRDLSLGKKIEHELQLPSYITKGSYRLKAEIQNNSHSASKEALFTVKALPILNLGGGVIATYPEILSKLGTISLWLLLLLIVWIFLFSREYWLSLHALRGITEKNLEKLGLISIKQKRGASK